MQYIDDPSERPVCKCDFHSRLRLISHLSETRVRSKYSGTNCRLKMLERQLVPFDRAKLEALNEKDRLLRVSARKLGRSHVVASNIVVKYVWIARLTRPDIYWTVNSLARHLTKWSVACDKRPFRLTCWVHQTADLVMSCYIEDTPRTCQIVMF